MKLTVVENTPEKLTARIEGVNAAYVNTLRRIMATEVPTLAVERVEISRNDSIMFDEMLAHRIGLTPLTTDLVSYTQKEQYGAPGNPATEVSLTLKVNPGKGITAITAGQLVSSDPKVKPVHADMPLVRVLEGQTVELVAYAELGLGKDHSKWSPGLITYRHYPHITLTQQPRNAERVAERYPGVFEVKGGKLAVAANGGLHLADQDLDLDGGEVTIEHKDDFIMTIESWGQLPAKTILTEGIKRYTEQLESFSKTL